MNIKNITKHTINIISVFSVLLLPFYMITAFVLLSSNPEYYYSWFFSNYLIADFSTISFILFFVAFIVSFKLKEKIQNTSIFIIFILISAFLLIFFSFTWRYEHYIILTIIGGPISGFSIPIMYEFSLNNIFPRQENRINIIISIVVFLGLLLYSFIIFNFLGLFYWRLIYVITGGSLIIVSFYVNAIVKT
ncbi:MAG: hypothetical protein ACFE8M_01315 [Candidatus Hermodarchaeota archaeon]